jgi:DNA-directed RNA polymerase subunit beta
MAYSYTERKRIRKNFGTRDSVLEIPYLLQMQKDAYTAFLQADILPMKVCRRLSMPRFQSCRTTVLSR